MSVSNVVLLVAAVCLLAALVICICLTGGCYALLLRTMQQQPQQVKEWLPHKSKARDWTETDDERRRRIEDENLDRFGTGVPQQEVR